MICEPYERRVGVIEQWGARVEGASATKAHLMRHCVSVSCHVGLECRQTNTARIARYTCVVIRPKKGVMAKMLPMELQRELVFRFKTVTVGKIPKMDEAERRIKQDIVCKMRAGATRFVTAPARVSTSSLSRSASTTACWRTMPTRRRTPLRNTSR